MSWQITLLLFSAVFELMMLLVIRGRLQTAVAGPFCLVLLFNALWAFNYALDLSSASLEEKVWLLRLRSTFLPFYALAWFETAYRFALGRPFLRGWFLAAALVVPCITVALAWLPGVDGVVYQTPWLDTQGKIPVLRAAPGPWGHVYNFYNYAGGLAALVVVQRTRLQGRVERVSTVFFMVGALLGVIADALYEFDLSPTPGLNYAPLILPLTSGLIAVALLGHRALDLAPVARAALIDRLEERLLVFDRHDRLIDVNDTAATALGSTASRLIGGSAREVLAPWPGAYELLQGPEDTSWRELALGASVFEGSVIAIKAVGSDQARVRILALRDITGRKQIEEQLRMAKEAAEAAEAAQARFLAMMSHEIRTPMNGVLGFTQLLAELPLPEEQRGYVDLIDQSGRSLLVIVNDVLDYSKIAAGQLTIERVPCNVTEIAGRVISLFQGQAQAKGIELTHRVAPDVPAQIIGDPVRLGQILTNLVGNAVKFTEEGRVAVDIDHVSTDGGPAVVMRVSDSGIGITPAQQARIFLPFNQADESTTRRFGGTGLGLTITRSLCGLMGGSLALESSPGRGSVFTATVKAEPARGNPATPPVAPAPPGAPGADVAHLRLLVFEDNLVNQAVIRALLVRLGHAPRFVGDGAAGLDVLAREECDAILMDIEMPVMDGYEAVRRIRAGETPGGHRYHIIGLTAHALKGERERCLAVGMDDFLTKPVSLQALREALARVPPRPAHA